MSDYTELLPRLIPQLLPAPAFVITDALQTVGVDFCTRTDIWQDNVQERIGRGETDIRPLLPKDQAMVRVLSLRLGGNDSPTSRFSVTMDGCVCLNTPACHDMDVTLLLSVRPTRTATSLPRFLFDEWGDVLAFGTLAKVKSMTGPRVDWTDPAGAQLNLSLYEEGVARARIRLIRSGGLGR